MFGIFGCCGGYRSTTSNASWPTQTIVTPRLQGTGYGEYVAGSGGSGVPALVHGWSGRTDESLRERGERAEVLEYSLDDHTLLPGKALTSQARGSREYLYKDHTFRLAGKALTSQARGSREYLPRNHTFQVEEEE
jgi:hypothetical protein